MSGVSTVVLVKTIPFWSMYTIILIVSHTVSAVRETKEFEIFSRRRTSLALPREREIERRTIGRVLSLSLSDSRLLCISIPLWRLFWGWEGKRQIDGERKKGGEGLEDGNTPLEEKWVLCLSTHLTTLSLSHSGLSYFPSPETPLLFLDIHCSILVSIASRKKKYFDPFNSHAQSAIILYIEHELPQTTIFRNCQWSDIVF